MPGEALRDSSPPHTAAAALYGWVIAQIGDSIDYSPSVGEDRYLLCSGKPAITLVREAAQGRRVPERLYLPWPITPAELAAALRYDLKHLLENERYRSWLDPIPR